MAGKISAVLAKKEAEVYRAQGLHKEALKLYARLLESTPHIDAAIRTAVQTQMEGICKELDDFKNQREQPLSVREISQIKEGWGRDASQVDILVCAHAFCQVGAYEDALEEIKRLLQMGNTDSALIGPLADCLIHHCEARDLPAMVNRMIQEVSLERDKAQTLQIELAERLESHSAGDHALALYRQLEQDPEMVGRIQDRLNALAARLQSPSLADAAAAEPEAGRPRLRPGGLFSFLKRNSSPSSSEK